VEKMLKYAVGGADFWRFLPKLSTQTFDDQYLAEGKYGWMSCGLPA
jgi:hypothetical protein